MDMAGSKRKNNDKSPVPDCVCICVEEGFYYQEVASRPLLELAGMASGQPG